MRLKEDLNNGEWEKKYGDIKARQYFDSGYRFLRFDKN